MDFNLANIYKKMVVPIFFHIPYALFYNDKSNKWKDYLTYIAFNVQRKEKFR